MAGELKHADVGPQLTYEEYHSESAHTIDGVPAGTVIANKVDKVSGKGLSTEDYTTVEKTKLAGIPEGGGSGVALGETETTAYRGDRGKTAYDHSQVAHAPSTAEANVNADWGAVSGDAQILNKPTIPDELADLSDDSTHRLVTDTEKSTWNGKTDLATVKADVDVASAISLKHASGSDNQDLSGLMVKTSNLSDVANTATAFGNIKQNATTSATGVVELATQAEVLAGADTSRAVVPIDLHAKIAVEKNPLAMAQGIAMTYAPSGSSGITVADNDNINFGTGDFTLVWSGSLPNWTPSNAQRLGYKYQDANNVIQFAVNQVTPFLYVAARISGTSVFAPITTIPSNLADGTAHSIIVSMTRGTPNCTASFYVDGKLFQTVSATDTGVDISNSGSWYISGMNAIRTASTTHSAIVYNRALSAAEVLSLYQSGIADADKWGSQTAVYTSDFSAGADSFGPARGTLDGNIDGISDGSVSKDDVLRFYADNTGSATHYFTCSTLTGNKLYRVTLNYYIPATNTNVNGFCLRLGNGLLGVSYNTTGQWVSMTEEILAGPDAWFAIYQTKNNNATFTGANSLTDDLIYVRDVVVTEIGAILALEPEGIQPAPGQWLDSSSNKLHAWQPAAGSSLTRYKNTFEIRGINTWAGTHEAQSIAWATDASKAILPAGCYIDSIIGVITGATIEDIIIGDGSDTDRWVEATTGLAAGTVAFTIANHISDGTNYEMVVDPDANFTGSIEWTIRGTILD